MLKLLNFFSMFISIIHSIIFAILKYNQDPIGIAKCTSMVHDVGKEA